MSFERRVAALPADRQALLADRLRHLGALRDPSEPAGSKRLVAYVVLRPGCSVEPADLRSFLRSELPEPMVPSAFVVLDEFPVTASGKLDRLSLPAPEAMHGAAAPEPSAAPATPEEAALAGLWREILGIDHVGKDDDFFAIGGDSILLLKLCARARERGLGLAPRDLFAHPVLGELAAALAARGVTA